MAKDSWAHLVLMAALERVDDTALLRKHVVAELMVRLSRALLRLNDAVVYIEHDAGRANVSELHTRAAVRPNDLHLGSDT